MNSLEKFGIIPVEYSTIVSILDSYNSPGDKIAKMEKKGDLLRLKKGLYVVSPRNTRKQISRELVANHLYGPSYVSQESALAYYKLIPERVDTVRSTTIRRTKSFTTPIGTFEYSTVPGEYYSIGVIQMIINNEYSYLIATPEKALCDLIITTPGIRIQSVRAMSNYIEEDLRIDLSALESFDLDIIKQCTDFGKKRVELTSLYNLTERVKNNSRIL